MTNYDILKEYETHKTPVPSYEEWQRIFHYASKYEYEYTSCAMDYENLKQENQQLKEENAQLHKFLEEFNALDVAKENQQLKELLSKARDSVQFDYYEAIGGGADYQAKFLKDLLTKIDNAIGEKK